MEHYGVTSTYYNGALSFSSLKNEIGYNRPIYVSIGWLDQNNNVIGGHAVVMDGYYEYTNYGYEEVRYMDPWDGTRKTMEYDSFAFSSGDQMWRWGLYNIKD